MAKGIFTDSEYANPYRLSEICKGEYVAKRQVSPKY